jgi:hypothetical protein
MQETLPLRYKTEVSSAKERTGEEFVLTCCPPIPVDTYGRSRALASYCSGSGCSGRGGVTDVASMKSGGGDMAGDGGASW